MPKESADKTETLHGQELVTRLAELRALGIRFVDMEVGETNSEWIISYQDRQPQPEQLEW